MNEAALLALVEKQACDSRLWCRPGTIVEDTLQRALRTLHEAIEGKTSSECAREVLTNLSK